MTTATQTVGEIAMQHPLSIPVFERYGIEYCCGGRMPLAEACELKDVAVEKVIAALEAASSKPAARARDWGKETLADLTDHIVAKHHTYCKSELVLLSGLAIKVTIPLRRGRPPRVDGAVPRESMPPTTGPFCGSAADGLGPRIPQQSRLLATSRNRRNIQRSFIDDLATTHAGIEEHQGSAHGGAPPIRKHQGEREARVRLRGLLRG